MFGAYGTREITRPFRSTTTALPCANAMPANDTVSRTHPSWRAGNLQAKRLNLNRRPPLLRRTIRIFISPFLSASLFLRGKQSSSLRPGQTSKSHASGGTRPYPEIKQAMRVLGNSTFNEPFDVVALTPRSTGYSTVGSGIVQGTSVFAGPSILQTASRVWLCDRIPKATGVWESVTSEVRADRREPRREYSCGGDLCRPGCPLSPGPVLAVKASRDGRSDECGTSSL